MTPTGAKVDVAQSEAPAVTRPNPETERARVVLPSLGATLFRVTSADALVHELAQADSESRRLIVTVNVDTLRIATGNDQLRGILRHAELVADGWPVAAFVGRAIQRPVARVAGSDIARMLVEGRGGAVRLMIVGASAECHGKLARRFARDRGVEVVASLSPDRQDVLAEDFASRLAEVGFRCRPQVVLFAFGQPLQEIVAARYLSTGGTGTCLGIGGALDMIAGIQARAPRLVQRLNLEWLWRALSDPRRLARRYVADVPLALRLLFARKHNVQGA